MQNNQLETQPSGRRNAAKTIGSLLFRRLYPQCRALVEKNTAGEFIGTVVACVSLFNK